MPPQFKDRADAGQKLAKALEKFQNQDPVVLALPRGGLPLGYEIARRLNAPLDVLLVRKIGAPMAEELAVGAIVDGDEPQIVVNEDVIRLYDIPFDYIEKRAAQQLAEIERRRKLYRRNRPSVEISGKTAIVVDDGIATGATVRAALKGLRKRGPKKLVLAVPVAPQETVRELAGTADEIVCLETPVPFYAVGSSYRNFGQLEDADVISYLEQIS